MKDQVWDIKSLWSVALFEPGPLGESELCLLGVSSFLRMVSGQLSVLGGTVTCPEKAWTVLLVHSGCLNPSLVQTQACPCLLAVRSGQGKLPGWQVCMGARCAPLGPWFALLLLPPPYVAPLDFDCRRRIRICCDELNLLVPFCNTETDKATTLQWTTAFLKYIQERHGDTLRKVSV